MIFPATVPIRHFAFTQQVNESRNLSLDSLFTYQKQFEQNPNNLEAGVSYFKELNRHGRFTTVVRIYNEHINRTWVTEDAYNNKSFEL